MTSLARHPCACCGHLTLTAPGDYEVCGVCGWEDDAVALRWPLRAEGGPNGDSLHVAQRSRRRRRAARPDEPLDPGWRAFDPELDWTEPTLESERWPGDGEGLYYWRPGYWNGDPSRAPAPPRQPTNSDRLVEHLRSTVPESLPVIESLEWQYGEAHAHRVCSLLAAPARAAFRDGDRDAGLRIVRGVAAGLDADSDTYVPNAVGIGFLEDHAWLADDLDLAVEEWPEDMRARIESQRQAAAEQSDHSDAWERLLATAPGRPVDDLLVDLEALAAPALLRGDPRTDLHLELMARVLSDHRWARHHPLAAVRFAWRHRRVQSPGRTVRSLLRPRFAG